MTRTQIQWFGAISGVFGAAIAYLLYALGVFAAGRFGVLTLVIGVPAGVVLGWLLAKLLEYGWRVLSDSE